MKTVNASTNKESIKSGSVANSALSEINGRCNEYEMENKYSLASLFMSILYHTLTILAKGCTTKITGNGKTVSVSKVWF